MVVVVVMVVGGISWLGIWVHLFASFFFFFFFFLWSETKTYTCVKEIRQKFQATILRMYLWWSWYAVCLIACHVGFTVGHSSGRCYDPVINSLVF